MNYLCFFFSSRRRHTRCGRDWSSDVCSSDLVAVLAVAFVPQLLGSEVHNALNGLSGARPIWLWAAGACFVASLAGSAAAYRAAFGLVGARLEPLDAAARYGRS